MRTENLRRTLIIAKALAYAIETIKALPSLWQEASDAEDMRAILEEMGQPWVYLATQSAKHHLDGSRMAEMQEDKRG
jgi:ketosteroid isomerase-like protein